MSRTATLFFLLILLTNVTVRAQDTGLLGKMAENEVAARNQHLRYAYLSEERSSRTGGRLWRENVVETDDGPIRRLLAVDGKPLSASEARAEDERIRHLVETPGALLAAEGARRQDESRATQLLALLPRAFIVTGAGEQEGCTRFAFRPNPSFQPSTYEERVAHAMGGTVSVKQPANRLCALDVKLLSTVEFGFGILGRLDQGGYFTLHRSPVDGKNWKSDRLSVHIKGRILMLKTLAREQDVVRTNLRLLPPHLPLDQAARLSLPESH